MDSQCTVQVKLELGHRAQLRKKPTTDGFTHDWMVFVRGPEQFNIQHFVEKVVFRLHDSFPKPKRVCKEPPYKVEETGYAGFILPIEVYFKNKEEPKKVCFTYDLFLNLEGNPPVNHLRCEKLTFNNPTKEFRGKLLKAGGVMVMPEGAEAVSRPSPDYPMLPTIPLSAFSDPKKAKPSHGSKDGCKDSSKVSKHHKVTKEHRERPRKDSESKGKESEPSKLIKESSSRKLVENKPPKEDKSHVKAAFKEQKLLKEPKQESMSPKGAPPEIKPSSKRPPNTDSPKSSKKPKKITSKSQVSSTSPRGAPNPSSTNTTTTSSYPEKKPVKEKPGSKSDRPKSESDLKKTTEAEDSNSDDEASSKSDSVPSSPSNSSSSSDSSSESDFEPSQKHSQGPLRSMVEDLQSEESDDDSSCGDEVARKTKTTGRDSRMSLSDSDSDSSDDSCAPSRGPVSIQKMPPANIKTTGRRSPESCTKADKLMKKGVYDKAYTDELVDLHRRLMALRERNVLQQIVNLIEETGHFNVTNTTFDFDLFSLDETTVRKLQSYLEAGAT
ncbi:protein ENL isoform X2 [Bombina bombina]|uniref:protein ENL isoform X2 n=1 Tax=Bombina bombina TaxID=8345 RepID=UPI00235A5A56|nr:protein ENL isoform X2 [Bombina bombina]